MEKKSLWVHCPVCREKTRTKVYDDTVFVNFPLYYPKCKREMRVNVANLRIVLSEDPNNIKESTSPSNTISATRFTE